jgi:hypothetical protein
MNSPPSAQRVALGPGGRPTPFRDDAGRFRRLGCAGAVAAGRNRAGRPRRVLGDRASLDAARPRSTRPPAKNRVTRSNPAQTLAWTGTRYTKLGGHVQATLTSSKYSTGSAPYRTVVDLRDRTWPSSPAHRAGGALERAGDVGGDPAAVEVALLRPDQFTGDAAFVDPARIEGDGAGEVLVAG